MSTYALIVRCVWGPVVQKLLENRMANFKVLLTHEWTADGGCVSIE